MGTQIVSSGQTFVASTLISGIAVSAGGTLDVVAGGTIENLVEQIGGVVSVTSGGEVSGSQMFGLLTAVIAGGLVVASGGVVNGAELGGSLTVSDGGLASGVSIVGGSETVLSGGIDSGATLTSNGAFQVLAGGVAVDTLGPPTAPAVAVIGSGAVESVTAGSTVSALILSGGDMSLAAQDSAVRVLIMAGGSLGVAGGGSVTDAYVVSGGQMTVGSGGVAIDAAGSAGGSVTVASGGQLQAVPGGGITVSTTSGTFVNFAAAVVTLQDGASMTVANGASAGVVTVQSGASLTVQSGGAVFGMLLDAGGLVNVAAGGGVDAVTISSGGNLSLGAGAFAQLPVLSGGGLILGSGASAKEVAVGPGGIALVESGATVDGAGVSGGNNGVVIDPGAVVLGGLAFAGFGGVIEISGTTLPNVPLVSFGPGDSVLLPDIPFDPSGSISSAGNVLSATENGQTYTFNLLSSGIGANPLDMVPTAVGSGTIIRVACFAEGTRIATDRGGVTVEALRVGDRVRTRGGRMQPVVWLGHRAVDCRRHPRPQDVLPVRIAPHAFGPDRPRRTLTLSPDHAVFVGGGLIPVRYLLNGASIAQVAADRVRYWHVELARHDVLLAENLACESYLDTGNRSAFAAAGTLIDAHADFARGSGDRPGCAPLVMAGPALARARARLIARLLPLGWRITADPGLHVTCDGRPLAAVTAGTLLHLALPAGARRLVVRSRTTSPADLDPGSDDRRRLGVALRGLRLDGAALATDDARLAAGWHPAEPQWRWSDGAGTIDVRGAASVALHLASWLRYVVDPADAPIAASPARAQSRS